MGRTTRPKNPPLMLSMYGVPLIYDPQQGRSSKAHEFLLATRDLRENLDSISPIDAFLMDDNGRLRLLIEVGERATADDLRNAAPLAFEYRNRLLKFQGRQRPDSKALIREELLRDKRRGQSYAHLARRINYTVAQRLQHGFPESSRVILRAMNIPSPDISAIVTDKNAVDAAYPVDAAIVRGVLRAYEKSTRRHRQPELLMKVIDDLPPR